MCIHNSMGPRVKPWGTPDCREAVDVTENIQGNTCLYCETIKEIPCHLQPFSTLLYYIF